MTGNGTTRADAWVLAGTILPSAMAFIDQSAVNITLPAIQADLHASGAQLLWTINGYTLMLASLIIVGGTLGDRIGRRLTYLIGICIFTVASAACAFSPSAVFLISARIAQGLGGALMIPGSLSIISAHFPREKRGAAIGTWSAVTTITTAGGPVLGGFFAGAGLWRLVFLINLPLGVVAFLMLVLKVPESRSSEAGRGIDIPGAATIAVALAGLSYALIAAPDQRFASPLVYGALITGVLSFAGFVVIERRSASPMVPLSIFRSLPFSGANLLTLFLYGSLTAFSFFLPLTMVQAQGYRESVAGMTMLPFVVMLAGMSRLAGKISDRIGPRVLLTVGPVLVGAGYLLSTFSGLTRGASAYWSTYFPAIVVFGAGMGMTVTPLTTTVMNSAGEQRSGTASGVNNAVSRIAGVLAIAVLGPLALVQFSHLVQHGVANFDISPTQADSLKAELSNLGNARVPTGITGDTASRIDRVLRISLVETFRIIMYVCTGLAWLSALLANIFLGRTANPVRGKPL
ncbi:MAG TPA: MFS transporter [Spirochaetia bacterium]|nr:MFS transporter [Spirochaetia bacterium]